MAAARPARFTGPEVARRIREGRPLRSIALARSTPVPGAASQVGIELPGTCPPGGHRLMAFLDRVAAGCFNTLVASCGIASLP